MRRGRALRRRYGRAAAHGQVQAAIIDYMTGRPGEVPLTSLTRQALKLSPAVHFKRIVSAADDLAKRGFLTKRNDPYYGIVYTWVRR